MTSRIQPFGRCRELESKDGCLCLYRRHHEGDAEMKTFGFEQQELDTQPLSSTPRGVLHVQPLWLLSQLDE